MDAEGSRQTSVGGLLVFLQDSRNESRLPGVYGPESFEGGSRQRIEGPSLRRRSWGRSLRSPDDVEHRCALASWPHRARARHLWGHLTIKAARLRRPGARSDPAGRIDLTERGPWGASSSPQPITDASFMEPLCAAVTLRGLSQPFQNRALRLRQKHLVDLSERSSVLEFDPLTSCLVLSVSEPLGGLRQTLVPS
jgi:hypothetical protein